MNSLLAVTAHYLLGEHLRGDAGAVLRVVLVLVQLRVVLVLVPIVL